ncbi:hypothetical protein [Streptomyces rimosus]|uniref:hypothetical protein n=1 Tax=Streptomyces rimosus TaxID=1927 RepID=UPI00131DE6EE|nr:hypothetical protein [Streptomyces rimosus]
MSGQIEAPTVVGWGFVVFGVCGRLGVADLRVVADVRGGRGRCTLKAWVRIRR